MEFELLNQNQVDYAELAKLDSFSPFSNLDLVKSYGQIYELEIMYAALFEGAALVSALPLIKLDKELISLGHLPNADLFDYFPIRYSKVEYIEKLLNELVKYSRSNSLRLQINEIPVEIINILKNKNLLELIKNNSILPITSIKNNNQVKAGHLTYKKKHLKEINRKIRRAEGEFSIRLENEIDKSKYLPDLIQFLSRSQNIEKRDFVNANVSEFYSNLVNQPEIKLTGLFLDDKIVSIIIYYDKSNIRYICNMASDTNVYNYSPGIIHTYRLILETVNENFDEFNFLRGTERYKFEIGANACKINYQLAI